jgi:hypothetical protein
MTERVRGWQCIGCGKVDAPQTCIGVCQDRRVERVHACDYDEALAALERARQRASLLEALARRLAHTHPQHGRWESSYRVLQADARATLAATAQVG